MYFMHKYTDSEMQIYINKKKKNPAFASGQEDSVARGPGIQENVPLHTHSPFEFLYPVRLLPVKQILSQHHLSLIQFTPI